MLEDVRHVDLLTRMGDVQITFVILTHYFVQQLSYLLQCTLTFSTFIKSSLLLTPPSFKCLSTFWVQNPLTTQKDF